MDKRKLPKPLSRLGRIIWWRETRRSWSRKWLSCVANGCMALGIDNPYLIDRVVEKCLEYRFWWIAYSLYKKFPDIPYFNGTTFEIAAHWFYDRRQLPAAIECLQKASQLRPYEISLQEQLGSWGRRAGGAFCHHIHSEAPPSKPLRPLFRLPTWTVLIRPSGKWGWWRTYEGILKAHPKNPAFDGTTCEKGAYYFYHRKELEPAIRLLAKAAERRPKDYNLIEQVGDWISYTGDMERAKRYWHNSASLRHKLCRDQGLNHFGRTLLKDDWTCRIGHFAYLDCFLKLAKLGFLEFENIMLVARQSGIANSALLRLFSKVITVHHIKADQDDAGQVFDTMRTDLNYYLLKGGNGLEVNEGAVLADQIWRDQKRGPLISLDDQIENMGQEFLRQNNLGPNDWFVVVHAREPGYIGKSIRDCDITTYLKAFRYIVDRGGWVIRLGDASMRPLSRTPRVIDYASHRFNNPNLDIFFAARARYAIGCASGMSYVPHIFGVPSLFVNWAPAYYRPIFHDYFYIPKTYLDRLTGEPLNFEKIAGTLESRVEDIELLHESNMDLLDNSPDEILDAVQEFFYIHENHLQNDPDYLRPTLEHQNISSRKGIVGQGMILPGYLRNHPYYAPTYRKSSETSSRNAHHSLQTSKRGADGASLSAPYSDVVG